MTKRYRKDELVNYRTNLQITPQWVPLSGSRNESTSCDRMCNGKKRVKYVCMKGDFQVDEHNCQKKEKKEEICNTHCDLKLVPIYGGCEPLNGTCGYGKDKILLRCFKIEKNNSSIQVDLSNCDKREISAVRQAYKKDCYVSCDKYKWEVYDTKVFGLNLIKKLKKENFEFKFLFYKCSVLCGQGRMVKSYNCHLIENNEVVDPNYCSNIEKPTSNEEIPCDVPCFKWQYSQWSEVINKTKKLIFGKNY
jgi:hypothetical protein